MNFLGIDLGTSSVKIIVMDEEGKVIASLSKEYPVFYPEQGWAEQNPEDWWNATKEGIKELIEKKQINGKTIKSIGFSGQMHGLVTLDENDKVLMPAILWCDQRTGEECEYITEVVGKDKLSKYTGNKALTGFTAPKILWIKKHRQEVYSKVSHILLPKDYIRFKLTGEYATDVSDASGTLLFDVENRVWSKEMLNALKISEDLLPKCYESSQVTGSISKEAALETGLEEGTLVVGGAGDQAAGAVGTGTVESGIISVAMGTSGVVFASQKEYAVDSENRLHSFCHANDEWHVMGVMLSAASCLKWWVEAVNKGNSKTFDELLYEAEKIPAGSEGLIFLPYLMGERTPYSDPYAKGCFIGLNITHTRAHMTRAILEGVAFGLKDSLELVRNLNIPINEVRVSGGGAKSKLWRQILADIFETRIDMINSVDGPSYGAAILAAVGAGKFDSVNEACSKLIKVTESVYPNKMNIDKYERMYRVYSSLYSRLKDTFNEIS
ncbi:xylulokinase [Clostridium sp. YIM B02515]|uniref:Xylulose kinase n=1 Tax=Clostridium rhizosphaerae TaxID=2803861 RepID=A0ABS1T8D2_9CLOT|nr:xylulokinase [Clostridium rhizosphaerae]MBL4934609.1 xylulokinase [Clostridium rhizosphaerae]